MRLMLSKEYDSPLDGRVPGEAAPEAEQPQALALSESDRDELYAWAAQHGFVLRNPVDIHLAEVVWRENRARNQTA